MTCAGGVAFAEQTFAATEATDTVRARLPNGRVSGLGVPPPPPRRATHADGLTTPVASKTLGADDEYRGGKSPFAFPVGHALLREDGGEAKRR